MAAKGAALEAILRRRGDAALKGVGVLDESAEGLVVPVLRPVAVTLLEGVELIEAEETERVLQIKKKDTARLVGCLKKRCIYRVLHGCAA